MGFSVARIHISVLIAAAGLEGLHVSLHHCIIFMLLRHLKLHILALPDRHPQIHKGSCLRPPPADGTVLLLRMGL